MALMRKFAARSDVGKVRSKNDDSAYVGRYLAVVATQLPGDTDSDREARSIAADIVLDSADAAWDNCLSIEGLPLFGSNWSAIATLPSFGASIARFAATGAALRSTGCSGRW